MEKKQTEQAEVVESEGIVPVVKHTTNLKAFPFNSTNPFLSGLMLNKKRTVQAIAKPANKIVVDEITGQIDDTVFIGIKKEVDSEQFVKIFLNQFATVFELSKAGTEVFKYVIKTMSFGDRIDFNLAECQRLTGYKSKVSILAGLTELLEKQFLARGQTPNAFFVNPTICYKGDRLVLIAEWQKKHVEDLESKGNPQMNLSGEL